MLGFSSIYADGDSGPSDENADATAVLKKLEELRAELKKITEAIEVAGEEQ